MKANDSISSVDWIKKNVIIKPKKCHIFTSKKKT